MGVSQLLVLVLRVAGTRIEGPAVGPFWAGRRLAVDVSGWLHKAKLRDAAEVVSTGVSDKAVSYMIQMVEGLLGLGATPVLVFDGASYPPKQATQDSRREKVEENRRAAEAAAADGTASGRALNGLFAKAALVQEPLLRAVMNWAIEREVEFVVAPMEADQQLVSVLDYARVDSILAASQDSDLAAYGGTSVAYDYSEKDGSCMHVCLLEDVLGKVVGEFDFTQWTYDRFLTMCIWSGMDYYKLKNHGLKTVYKEMAKAIGLKDQGLALGDMPHPPLADRPGAWLSEAAVRLYSGPMISKLGAEGDAEFKKVWRAFRAVRYAPVFTFNPATGDKPFAFKDFRACPPTPLESRGDRDAAWSTVNGVDEAYVAGLDEDWNNLLEWDENRSTSLACGLLTPAKLLEPSRVRKIGKNIVAPGDDDEFGYDSEGSTGGVEGADDASLGRPGEISARPPPNITKENYMSFTIAQLRSWLHCRGILPYENARLGDLRKYVYYLIHNPLPPKVMPWHPLLNNYSRPSGAVQLDSMPAKMGADFIAAVHDCTRARSLARSGLRVHREGECGTPGCTGQYFCEIVRAQHLPFETTRERGCNLYNAGRNVAPKFGYVHSLTAQVQTGYYYPTSAPTEASAVSTSLVGRFVRMHSLVADQQLNGVVGYSQRWLPTRGRYQVWMPLSDDEEKPWTWKAIVPEKLKPAPHPNPDPVWNFLVGCHASMRSVDHRCCVAVTPKDILTAPATMCSCESGICCAHQDAALRALYVAQLCSSWDEYKATVRMWDKETGPSGAVRWWDDAHRPRPKAPAAAPGQSAEYNEVAVARAAAAAPAPTPAPADAADGEAEAPSHLSSPTLPSEEPGARARWLATVQSPHFRGSLLALYARAQLGDDVVPPVEEEAPADEEADAANVYGEDPELELEPRPRAAEPAAIVARNRTFPPPSGPSSPARRTTTAASATPPSRMSLASRASPAASVQTPTRRMSTSSPVIRSPASSARRTSCSPAAAPACTRGTVRDRASPAAAPSSASQPRGRACRTGASPQSAQLPTPQEVRLRALGRGAASGLARSPLSFSPSSPTRPPWR